MLDINSERMTTVFPMRLGPHADAARKGPGNQVEIEPKVDSYSYVSDTNVCLKYQYAANGNVMK